MKRGFVPGPRCPQGLGVVLALAALILPTSAFAQTATFALVVGTNDSVDEELDELRYADDDASRYFDLFRSLGARTYLLTRLDDDTARLHPQAAAEAEMPRGAQLDAIIGLLKSQIDVAKERDLKTVFYFVYAGHGNVDGNKGYITLEDERLFGDDVVERILEAVDADDSHLIVDACYSFFLAYGRGPGGKRREISGFAKLRSLAAEGEVGLILSTSSAAESHEWEAFQAGVFSHEIRSALYGAADADQDGVVTYREVASFVENANANIPNEKYRPKLHARPPSGSGALLDLRSQEKRLLEIGPDHAGRYLLENHDGVRLVDFHSGPGHGVRLVRPSEGTLYLRAPDEGVEYEVPPSEKPVRLAMLTPAKPRVQGRGAAHTAFSKLFEKPFTRGVVAGFSFKEAQSSEGGLPWGAIVGVPVMAVGSAFVVGALAAGGYAGFTYFTAGPDTPQTEVVARNQAILGADLLAIAAVGIGIPLAILGAATWLFWPSSSE